MRRVLVVLTVLCAFAAPFSAAAQEPGSQSAVARPTVSAVNLNTATAQQLETLPGIGPRTAQRIIEYREKNGPFKKVEDLMNIQGIGEKNFLRVKGLVSVTPAKADKPAGSDR